MFFEVLALSSQIKVEQNNKYCIDSAKGSRVPKCDVTKKLVTKVRTISKIKAENTVVCMASLLSLNGHISLHFETIHLKLSTHAYLTVFIYFMLLKYEDYNNRFL